MRPRAALARLNLCRRPPGLNPAISSRMRCVPGDDSGSDIGVIPTCRPSTNTVAPAGPRFDHQHAGCRLPAADGALAARRASTVTVGCAALSATRRSSALNPSRSTVTRTTRNGMSRSTSGVRPRTRPSTRTRAPGGVDRTTSRPGGVWLAASPPSGRRRGAAGRERRGRRGCWRLASAAERPLAEADCARLSPRVHPTRTDCSRRRRRRRRRRWRFPRPVDGPKGRPVTPAKPGGDAENQRHDQRQEGSPLGGGSAWRQQRRRRPRRTRGAPSSSSVPGARPSPPARMSSTASAAGSARSQARRRASRIAAPARRRSPARSWIDRSGGNVSGARCTRPVRSAPGSNGSRAAAGSATSSGNWRSAGGRVFFRVDRRPVGSSGASASTRSAADG